MKPNQFLLWSLVGIVIALVVTGTASYLHKPQPYELPSRWTKAARKPAPPPDPPANAAKSWPAPDISVAVK